MLLLVLQLYSSGYVEETWILLWKIYYDFYAEKNGSFERKMKQYYRGWEKINLLNRL